MGKSTFSGPIRAGDIPYTTGTTVGDNVANVGSVVMVQHFAITQALSASALGTTIVLPKNSHIIGIQVATTVAWSGGGATLSLGTTVAANELVFATAVTSIGYNNLTPGTDPTRTAAWDDTGTTDKRIFALSASTGAGVGTLVVRYIQSHDLP